MSTALPLNDIDKLATEAAQAELVLKILRGSPDASCAPVQELITLVSELHADAVRRLDRAAPRVLDA